MAKNFRQILKMANGLSKPNSYNSLTNRRLP